MEFEVDYSDVAGRKAECPDGCGMCCLCQPEVLMEERAFFRTKYPDHLVKTKGEDPHFALSMKKGCGSCAFLSDGTRKCQIYDHRTAYCKQFPYHIYVSDRVKVELDYSCRGVWTGKGNDALTEAKQIVAMAERRIGPALKESREVYSQFMANCREAGISNDPSMIRMSVAEKASEFTDLGFLSGVLDASMMEPVMKLDVVKKDPAPDMVELDIAASEIAMESLNTDNPMYAPVYCSPDFAWNVFLSDGETIEWNILKDNGDVEKKGTASFDDIHLAQLDQSAKKVMADYISILNGRDSFLGSVYYMMDQNGYEDDMANAYYASMATSALDLMWRMSLLDHFTGCGTSADGIREAIIFYDMDRLDAPTIGGFV